MKKVYFISGLGADKRVYSFLDLSFCQPVFIEWIKPVNKETLQAYALRLREMIDDPEPVIVGISFGGMLVTEMAKADPAVYGIILSSNKVSKEFPRYLRVGKYLPLYKILPAPVLRRLTIMFSWILGAKGKASKKIIKQMVKDTDTGFLKWAIGAILSWNNNTIPPRLVHVHGTADRLLLYKLVTCDHMINEGAHVMPLDEHKEISVLLKKLVQAASFSAIA